MSEERQKILSQRFGKRGEKTETGATTERKGLGRKVERRRHSLYLDNSLVARMDGAYKAVAHDIYPIDLDKATFMEALLAYGLDHIQDIQASLVTQRGAKPS